MIVNAHVPMLEQLRLQAAARGWDFDTLRKFRMEGEGATGEGGTAEGGTGTGGTGGIGGTGTAATGQPPTIDGEMFGFPAGTPVADMSQTEQAEYWRHKAKLHEHAWRKRAGDLSPEKIQELRDKASEYDELLASTKSDTEKLIDQAKKDAETAARADERAKALPRIVDAELRAAAEGRVSSEALSTAIEPLDRTYFLSDTGEVDQARVAAFVATLAPSDSNKKTFPDLGQGRRTEADKASVARGAARYRERHPAKTQS